jgi:biotin carboxyl carrier protein
MVAELTAPMGGKILKVLVQAGDQISEDQELVILEAMKMELPLTAEGDGQVSAVNVQPGETVEAGMVLVVID